MSLRDQMGTVALTFIFHAGVAMLATPLIAVILLGGVSKFVPSNASPTVSILYDCAFMLLPGLLSGFLVMRRVKSPSAYWVWTLGVAWIALGFWQSLHFLRFSTAFRWLVLCNR